MSTDQFLSPSQQDGISTTAETEQLAYAADLIRESAESLCLPHAVCVSAQLLLQRFYTRVSLKAHSTVFAAGACIMLRAKLGDEPRSVRHVANVLYDRLCEREGRASLVEWKGEKRQKPLDFFGAAGYDWKHGLISTERHILKELGFRLETEVPHKLVLIFVNTLREKAQAPAWTEHGIGVFQEMLQMAWNFANDSMRVRVCVTEEADAVACACIALATERLGESLPEGWEEVFGCEKKTLERVKEGIRQTYGIENTDGSFMDYSLSAAFQDYHPLTPEADGEKSGQKRLLPADDKSDGKAQRERKKSRLQDSWEWAG